MEINQNSSDNDDIDDGGITTGTTYAQVHGMTTTQSPLRSNQQAPHIPSSTKEGFETHSKDFEATRSAKAREDIICECGPVCSSVSSEDQVERLCAKYPKNLENFCHPERDTRGRQYLLLTLERLSYLALENQRLRNYRLGRPLGLYISFTEPVPLLTKNKTWPRHPNPAHFELPTLIREVQFPRKFINQNQRQSALEREDRLGNHGLRNSFCTSDMGRCGHFKYITRDFRNLSFHTLPDYESNVSHFPRFIGTEDILGTRTLTESRAEGKVASDLDKDRAYLESVNVWHLVNLRSNPNSLYYFDQRSQSDMGLQVQTYSHSPVPTNRNHRTVHQMYSDFMKQDLHPEDIFEDEDMVLNFIDEDPPIQEVLPPPEEERPSFIDFRIFIASNSSESKYPFNRVNVSPASGFGPPEESFLEFYQSSEADISEPRSGRSSTDKKTVSFAPETIFIERDMDSPFWRDFTERRRRRRIMRQQRIMSNLRNRMSLFDLLKLHFRSPFHNNKKPEFPVGEISSVATNRELMLNPNDFSSQRKRKPDCEPKRSRLSRFFSCSCCSSSHEPRDDSIDRPSIRRDDSISDRI